METINSLLNLPEYATASDRACAVYELIQEHENIQAARATAESELSALREATSHIFAESICAARGITDASVQEDIRAAWCQDPYAALNAFAGENVTAANPYGCNQYGHEWRAKHGEGWRGGKQPEDTLETLSKRKFEKGVKSQDLSDKIVKLAKKTEVEKDKNKIKEINLKIKKLSEEKKKLDNEIQEISMKEVELRDRERYNNSQKNEKTAKEEAKEWNEASPEKRQEIMQRWKNKVRKAKKDYNNHLNFKKEGEDEYENEKKRLKKELEKAIEEFEEKVVEAGKLRNWSEKQSRSTARTLLIPVI